RLPGVPGQVDDGRGALGGVHHRGQVGGVGDDVLLTGAGVDDGDDVEAAHRPPALRQPAAQDGADPPRRTGDQHGTAHGSRPMNRTRNSPSRSAAARPAASTSAWSSGSPVIPAAALVTIDRPNTSRPAALAAIASSAVDIPTRSAPSPRSMRISAGVS